MSEPEGPSAGPVKAQDRIETLDFVRGIAVMGILIANIIAFGQPFSAYLYPAAWLGEYGDPDGWLWIAQFVAIDGKMRVIFTLLFGAGLYLFMERAWARGQTRWLQAWRLFILLAIGLFHFFFLWQGDILALYGMCGLAALPLLKLSVKRMMGIGVTAYVVGALFLGAVMGPLGFVADMPTNGEAGMEEFQSSLATGKTQALEQDAALTELKLEGSYAEIVAHKLSENTFDPFINAWLIVFECIPMMLIGMALYRLGFFSGGVSQSDLKKWGWIAVAIGGLGSLAIGLYVQASGFSYYSTLSAFFGLSPFPRAATALGLAALLVAYSQGWSGWLSTRIRAAGRAAFTNYLGTSVVMVFVMHGWALGLFGQLSRPELYIVVLLCWALMLAWSKPWLDRFRYGPLEWLWRCLTYRQRFPLRR
ncbi:DUF418 domain-containing protein [Qipengyuania sp. S6317L1]|uniref:DUF418 domain-containing protein n=1 Tax=Qipengyuania sp. S6317L1 TaxID=2926410 RepID=UPI001FF2E1B0|nr:DUF418 domain-containing protein [Qipengyuania sp. S6317L1]MCK0099832.1 DUF418 domain-containing protein [Qipengyuania sp. S6317L1]